ncbi:hypothetical protein NE237_021728 [Protea cynaroides]|uniref:Uncharacterized protein n=1 Tax=Protea cynaroides TaxID=273540 RepID=A0A9Q0K553_9MAGN|nr:hypothetical protein NE237_021728 [Protea cynaroides]
MGGAIVEAAEMQEEEEVVEDEEVELVNADWDDDEDDDDDDSSRLILRLRSESSHLLDQRFTVWPYWNQSHNLVTAGLFVLCSSSPPGAGVIGGDKGYGRGSGLLVNHNAIMLWDREVFVPPRVGIEGVQMGRQSRMDSLPTSQVASPTVVTVSNMERSVEQPTIVFAVGSKEVVLDQSEAANHCQVRFVDHPSQKNLDRVA